MALCLTFEVTSMTDETSEGDKTEGNFLEFLTRGTCCMLRGRLRICMKNN